MKNVYIPIEISARELDAKLLLARQLAANDVNVVIGKKKQLIDYMEVAAPGVFVSIWGGHRNFKSLYQTLSERGFQLAALDEEGLITISDRHYLENSVDKETLAHIQLFFCWGQKQKTLLERHMAETTNAKTKFVASGNIRFDLLRQDFDDLFRPEQQAIESKYPDCLLVISSFGFARHFDGANAYFQNLIKSGVIWNEELHVSYENYLAFQKHNALAFLDLVGALCAEFPEKQIVYRPHPSESIDDLSYLSETFDNFFVDSSHSIIPWLRSVCLTIFNYCTTGPEAQIVNCPNIAYRPVKDEAIEDDIPYRNTIAFESKELLVDHIRQMSSHALNAEVNQAPNFKGEISGLGDDWAVQKVARELLKLLEDIPSEKNTGLLARMRALLKNRLSRETDYVLHKYGAVDLCRINAILGCLPDFGAGEVKAKKIGRHLYQIGRKQEH